VQVGLVVAAGLVAQPLAAEDRAVRSELDGVIAPEVKNDAFYQAIYRLARTEQVATILEIGSSSGEGSTEALVLGMRKNPCHPQLFCMEVSKPRFKKLREHYGDEPSVHCYNASSIPVKKFATEREVTQFYQTVPSKLNDHPLATVLRWLKQDIDYLRREGASQNGIARIRRENGIKSFDMVLIDGSEFTAKAELDQVYGARLILLDDTCTFKNHANRERLLNDPDYALIEENPYVRNGYAIFKRKEAR